MSDTLERRAEELLEAFGRHELAKAVPDAAFTADMLLHYRRHLDDDLTRWTVEELGAVLLGLFPAKVVIEADEVVEVVEGVGAFLSFLDATGRLAPKSDPLPTLLSALEVIGEQLPAAMADTSRFGMAKSIGTAMAADGVDVTDDDAVQEWIAAFNARPEAERRQLTDGGLGFPTLPATTGRLSLPPDLEIPPVELAPTTELAAMAAAAPAFARLKGFVDYLGIGRTLTKTGNLTVADGTALARLLGTGDLGPTGDRRVRTSTDLPEVDLTFAWADEAGLVDIHPPKLVPTRLGIDMARQPLEAWWAAFEGLLALGPASFTHGWVPWADMLDDGMADLLVLAYLDDEPLDIAALAAEAWEPMAANLHARLGIADRDGKLLLDAVTADLGRLVDLLAGLGAVEREGSAVSLTPLGRWAARRLLLDDGFEAPLVGELAGADAAVLLSACAHYELDAATAEIDAWLAPRPPADAVGALAEGARALAGSADARPLFFHALGRLGPEAADAVRGLQSDRWLRPYATAWLMEHGLEGPASLSGDDVAGMLLDQLAALLAGGGPVAAVEVLAGLGPPAEQAALVDQIWRTEDPAAVDVLEAIGRHHPDKTVAKAARKALFKRRSQPGSASPQE